MTSAPHRDESGSRSLSDAVIRAIADAEGVDPLDLDPLYEVIDPDALDTLFDRTDEDSRREGRVQFRASGYRVEVTSTGRVHVTSLETLEAGN